MTPLDLLTTLSHLVEEFDRLRLALADRLTPAEEGTFTALVSALDTTIDKLPTLVDAESEP